VVVITGHINITVQTDTCQDFRRGMCEQLELKLPVDEITQYGFHFTVAVIMGHITEFSNTTMLDTAPDYMDRLVKETTEIRILPRNLIRDRGFNFSQSCYPVTNTTLNQSEDRNRINKLMTLPTSTPLAYPQFPSQAVGLYMAGTV
jgi:uncharacterized protein YqiB (DUF1249 family)